MPYGPSNSMFLSPLKPRSKNREPSKPLKDPSTDPSLKEAEKADSDQDVKSQQEDTPAGDCPHKHNSSSKREALKRGLLVLRSWHKRREHGGLAALDDFGL
jgi:hypothetical protein